MTLQQRRRRAVDAPPGYRVGARSRWLLGDLDHLYLTCRGRSVASGGWTHTWRALVEFLKLVQRDTRYEVNRWDDMKPFFTELRRYVSRAS